MSTTFTPGQRVRAPKLGNNPRGQRGTIQAIDHNASILVRFDDFAGRGHSGDEAHPDPTESSWWCYAHELVPDGIIP